MCRDHWYMVPAGIRADIWHAYVPGQERLGTPSARYLSLARAAIAAVARIEGAGPLPPPASAEATP